MLVAPASIHPTPFSTSTPLSPYLSLKKVLAKLEQSLHTTKITGIRDGTCSSLIYEIQSKTTFLSQHFYVLSRLPPLIT